MRRKLLLAAIIVFSFTGSYLGKIIRERKNPEKLAGSLFSVSEDFNSSCRRIVSLAPSITETLFALELGKRVVGVTRYCQYPPEAKKREKVGGYLDPNYEAILALAPNLVIMLEEQKELQVYLEELGLKTLRVNHKNISGILSSIRDIGGLCGERQRAGRMTGNLERRMARIKNKIRGLASLRVMIAVGRDINSPSVSDVYLSGNNGFYNELLTLAGGKNIYDQQTVKLAAFSREMILRLNPEVIIELVPRITGKTGGKKWLEQEWRKEFFGLEAVRNRQIYIWEEDYALIPGPRFILLLEEFARALHPEADWESQLARFIGFS